MTTDCHKVRRTSQFLENRSESACVGMNLTCALLSCGWQELRHHPAHAHESGVTRAGTATSPRTLSYNPAENAVLLHSDMDGGSYELYTIPKDANGSTVVRTLHAVNAWQASVWHSGRLKIWRPETRTGWRRCVATLLQALVKCWGSLAVHGHIAC